MHRYIIRRLLYMIPTLFVVSVLVFTVQELAPGDYVTRLVSTQQTAGGMAHTEEEIQAMRRQYGLDRPAVVRYFVWMGRFLRGDFGVSYEYKRPVSELIRERLVLSALLAYSTILLSWLLSIPIGVYVATHKYSLPDRLLTVVGFAGMSVPSFLLALILLYVGLSWFGVELSGLFSPEYADAPWSLAKLANLLQRLWIPVLILGTAGIAGSIRTWRALMLDTLGEPYIKVARAKGLPERTVVWKHALKVAANPFIGSLGSVLAAILSGEIIVSITMNLPTTGPLFYNALRTHDTYLSSAFLMFVTVLNLVGVLVSDIALALVDPRIRYE